MEAAMNRYASLSHNTGSCTNTLAHHSTALSGTSRILPSSVPIFTVQSKQTE